jgi:HD-like signal output (HDOD) protein
MELKSDFQISTNIHPICTYREKVFIGVQNMALKQEVAEIIRNKKTELPTLPVIVDKILLMARDDRTSAKDLGDFIINDQAICNKVLRLSNCAYYGMVKKVSSIQRAITIIGFNEVIGLTIGMSVLSTLNQKGLQDMLDMREFWIHSIGCATAAKEIAKRMGINDPEQIFLSGLLHDTGKIIMAVYFPQAYKAILAHAKDADAPLHRKEREFLGGDHSDISGLLMEQWDFPDELRLPSHYHHNPKECPASFQQQAMIVHAADCLARKARIGKSGNPVVPKLDAINGSLKISTREFERMTQDLKDQRQEIEEFFEILN